MEHVVQLADNPTDGRVSAVLERLKGRGAEVRDTDPRAADLAWRWLLAAKGRMAVPTVRRHVCRHDEGVGDCRPAVVEG